MDSNKSIKITIKYETSDGIKEKVCLSVGQYFENSDEEEISIDSSPIFNHAYEYINLSKNKLKYTDLNITHKDQSIEIYEIFWNNGENSFIESKFDTDSDKSHQIIIISKISDNPEICEIMKFDKKGMKTNLIFHVFEKETNGGTIETKIYPNSTTKV